MFERGMEEAYSPCSAIILQAARSQLAGAAPHAGGGELAVFDAIYWEGGSKAGMWPGMCGSTGEAAPWLWAGERTRQELQVEQGSPSPSAFRRHRQKFGGPAHLCTWGHAGLVRLRVSRRRGWKEEPKEGAAPWGRREGRGRPGVRFKRCKV